MPGILATSDRLLESRSFMKKRQGSREGAKTRRKPPILEHFAPSRLRVSPPKSAIKMLRFPRSLLRWSGQLEGMLRCLPARLRTDQRVCAGSKATVTSPMKSRMNAANAWRATAVFHIKIGSWKHPLLFNLRPGGTKWGQTVESGLTS